MTEQKTRFASRYYSREDGLEYTGEIYSDLSEALVDIRATLKELGAHTGHTFDWNLYEWTDNGYGEIIAGSDI